MFAPKSVLDQGIRYVANLKVEKLQSLYNRSYTTLKLFVKLGVWKKSPTETCHWWVPKYLPLCLDFLSKQLNDTSKVRWTILVVSSACISYRTHPLFCDLLWRVPDQAVKWQTACVFIWMLKSLTKSIPQHSVVNPPKSLRNVQGKYWKGHWFLWLNIGENESKNFNQRWRILQDQNNTDDGVFKCSELNEIECDVRICLDKEYSEKKCLVEFMTWLVGIINFFTRVNLLWNGLSNI